MGRQNAVAEAFVELSGTLVVDIDVVDFLHLLTGRCVQLLEVEAASVMVAGPDGELQVIAASSGHTRLVELCAIGAAPYAVSFATGEPLTADLATAGARWPQFTRQARDLGFRSVHAIPMRLHGEIIGVLTLFREQSEPLCDADVGLGQALADLTTAGLLRHRPEVHRRVVADQLAHAISTRLLVEQARGVLAERLRVDVDVALDELHRHSARTGRALGRTAAAIVDGDHVTARPDGAGPADPILLMRAFTRETLRPVRDLVRGRLAAAGLSELSSADFLFAVHEALANAVMHGGTGGRLWLWRDADSLWCEISDDGPGMPAGAAAPGRAPGPHAESGRGLWLISQICTSLDITATAAGGARVLLRFPAPGAQLSGAS
jgi:anti-sigma regulatory factor (Ser/Thr protein kinase)